MDSVKEMEAHDAELAQVFTVSLAAGVNASLSRKTRSQRLIISRAETLVFCQGLKADVNISWGVEDIDRVRSLDASGANMQDKVISLGHQMAAQEAAQQDDALDQDVDLDHDTRERVDEAALQIKATMTRNSAPPPAYLAACEWVDVDAATRRFYPCPEDKGDKSGPEVQLKFWQPVSE